MTTTPRWLSSQEQQAWRAFLLAHQLLFAQLDRELQASSGIPLAYYEILVRLSDEPDQRLRMSQLAESSSQSRSRLSHAVSRLEELGWVRRESCESDKRGAFAVLTDQGLAALVAAAPVHVEGVRRHLFDQLTSEQVAQLHDISRALAIPLASDAQSVACGLAAPPIQGAASTSG